MSLIGSNFKNDTPFADIIEWAIKSVAQLQAEEFAIDIFTHCTPKTAAETYPELDKIASDIEKWCVDAINNRRQHVKTECPYPGQCILEILIAKLERDE